MVAERCVSKSGAVSADPHHTCRYGSSPAAHRLVVPVLSFPSDREPSLYHRSRLASCYTRTDQPQPIDAIGPDLRSVHGATSRAALSSGARCRTIALSRPPAPAQDCPGSCCAPPHATASDRTPCRRMFAKRHREDRIDVSFHGSGSVACEDRDGACPSGGSSTSDCMSFPEEATHPRYYGEGYPDWPGRASNKEGESWTSIAGLSSESIRQSCAMRLRSRRMVVAGMFDDTT